ncbi:MAG: arylsulfatase [Zavarzinella sp.]
MKPLFFVGLLAVACSATVTQADDRPNIIVIMSDDMGFSDIGCYGGEIQTPNLDRMAANGVRFTQFYNTARCCPTRASLLTGLYPHQAGVGHMMEDRNRPGYKGNLNKNCRTMAEALRPAGYRSYAVGKWHVTRSTSADGPKENWPLQRGFDRFYGTITGAGSFFDPSTLVKDNTMISPFADPEYQPKTYYYTDAISEYGSRFIKEHAKKNADQPFMMYVTYTAAHWPMHALPEDIAKYRGKYSAGYEAIRKARFEKAVKLGLIDPMQGMVSGTGDWDAVKNKEFEEACMEVYAAMIDRMDQGIGQIIKSLEATKQLDNTLILFMQDNGGCAEGMGRTPNKTHPDGPRPGKPVYPPLKNTDLGNGGIVPDQTRDGFPVRMGPNVIPGGADTYVAYGRDWATVSNTPFREYKHWVHEGGISTPLIAYWPKKINGDRTGKLVKSPAHLIDIMATCVDLGQAKYPTEVDGNKITPLEGVSLAPAFAGQELQRTNPLFWEHEGNRAVRAGDWKLVSKYRGPWELYNIAKDRVELNNLADKMPEKVKELATQYDQYAKRALVVDWAEFTPKKKNNPKKK